MDIKLEDVLECYRDDAGYGNGDGYGGGVQHIDDIHYGYGGGYGGGVGVGYSVKDKTGLCAGTAHGEGYGDGTGWG